MRVLRRLARLFDRARRSILCRRTFVGIHRCDSARPPAQKTQRCSATRANTSARGECWAQHTEHRCRRRRRRRRTRAGASRTWSSSSCSGTAPIKRRSSRTSSGGTGAARTRRRRASRRCSRRRRQRPGALQSQPPPPLAGRPSRRPSPCRKIGVAGAAGPRSSDERRCAQGTGQGGAHVVGVVVAWLPATVKDPVCDREASPRLFRLRFKDGDLSGGLRFRSARGGAVSIRRAPNPPTSARGP